MKDNLEQNWLLSEEYKAIRVFSEWLSVSARQLRMPENEIVDILSRKQELSAIIKKAWLERNQNV